MLYDNDRGAFRNTQQAEGEDANRLAVFEQYRGLLFSIAYRMLASVADAEDILQEAFIRWQQASTDDIHSPRAYLVTIVSRLCLTHLHSARVRREEYVGQWLPEPLATDPESDPLGMLRADESLSMAFLVLLERLTPVERAVFLLREVFECGYAEIAESLGQTEANCRQILHRARLHVGDVRQRFQATAREHNDLLDHFLQASRSGDMEGLMALLSGDVVLHSDGGGKSIAVPNRIQGAERVARGVVGGLQNLVPKDLVSRLVHINGRPGVVSYRNGKPYSVLMLDVNAGKVRAIFIVTNPEKLRRLPGLMAAPN